VIRPGEAREKCILLGTIARAHGVRGELILRTKNPHFDPEQDWESVFLEIDGILVPFFISTLQPFRKDEWIMKLDWYDDKTRAGKLVGYPVWGPAAGFSAAEAGIFMDELSGFSLYDTVTGKTGKITGFTDVPENPLIEAEIDGETVMIPAREEFILEVNEADRTIRFRLPRGLI
jgi:16S rRNA processing protein RimM